MRVASYLLVVVALVIGGPVAIASDASPSRSILEALALDSVFVQTGRASDTTTVAFGVQWDWSRSWSVGAHGRISGYNEVSVGHWRADDGRGSAVVTQAGFTPTLRYWPEGAMARWFFELGVGVNLLAPVYRTREKRFSTVFNFGDHLAVGYRTAGQRRWEWSLRVQHFSNAGIDHPNPGENFVQLRLNVPVGRRAGT